MAKEVEEQAQVEVPAEPLTPEQEWEIINTPQFNLSLRKKIQDVRGALADNDAIPTPPGVETNVDGVYVLFYEEGNFLDVSVGKTSEGHPQVVMKIPHVWLEGP